MTVTNPISTFDGKTISHTYDNGWSFTNRFEGHLRITNVPVRGELREYVEVVLRGIAIRHCGVNPRTR